MLDKIGPKEKEIISGGKKIVYEIHMHDGEYKGITIDIIDLNEPMLDAAYLSLNESLYTHSIECNFNPNATSHSLNNDAILLPKESYVIDGDILEYGLQDSFYGEYLGNIIFNTPQCKKIACFISQNDKMERYYQFLDLTGTNVLACTEWDFDYEYLGIDTDVEGHEEYLERLQEMATSLCFTTLLQENGKEKLIDFNGEGATEEGAKKFEIFKSNILDVLNKGYELFQPQDKPKLESNDNNDEMNR